MSQPAIYAAKLALFEQLTDAGGVGQALDGVQISWADPGDKLARRAVFLAPASSEEEPAGAGSRVRNEDILLRVVVFVLAKDTAQNAEVSMWELVAAVRDAITTDLSLGGALVAPMGVTRTAVDVYPTDQGVVANATLEVSGTGRATP